MKIFIKLMLLALILSYASLFIIKKPDGTPIKTLDQLRPDFNFSAIRDSARNIFPSAENSSGETYPTNSPANSGMDVQVTPQEIYRWQDEQGNWHYSNSPPAGIETETMDLQAPTVMTLYRAEQNENEEENGELNLLSNENEISAAESESSLIPARIRQLQDSVQQAQDVSEQFQQKLDEQQQVLDAL